MLDIDKEVFTTEHAQRFARASLRHYQIYTTLHEYERDLRLRGLIAELARITKDEFAFWGRKGMVRGDEAKRPLFILGYVVLRRLLGVTMTTHLIINRERARLSHFEAYCADCLDLDERKAVVAMIARSLALVPASEDPRYRFFSYVILGFNDALIELTGALVGFSLALREPKIVIVAGLVSGITAAASISASAYLEAEHENGKDPHRAAFYSGMSYLGVAALLVLPFIVTGSILWGVTLMLIVALALVFVLALYSSVVLGKSYLHQVRQILALSLGVAFISFSVGYLLNLLVVDGRAL
jgi:VIT1/CCC1 family predicted Fe2+/Mn2+ transporter